MKILLNAEAFGFGPSAGASVIFDIIKNNFNDYIVDYIGQGHTLDLQSKLSYSCIYEYQSENQFKELVKGYDFFITALDFEKAKFAKEVGIKTIVYDTLLWYWKDKSIVQFADYYITQNFYGVKETLESMSNELIHTQTHIIPPLIQKKDLNKKCEDFLLINFGGLENPYWTVEVTAHYIQKILSIILPIVQSQFKIIKIVCSQNHIPYLKGFPVETASYKEMQNFLQKASLVIATSGLGNIYEIANYQVNSLFLPPVNDSQGQQLEILKQKGLIDNALDWSEFQCSIDYFKNQLDVLNDIKEGIDFFNFSRFSQLFQDKLNHNGNTKLYDLFEKFGFNGKDELGNVLKEILKT